MIADAILRFLTDHPLEVWAAAVWVFIGMLWLTDRTHTVTLSADDRAAIATLTHVIQRLVDEIRGGRL